MTAMALTVMAATTTMRTTAPLMMMMQCSDPHRRCQGLAVPFLHDEDLLSGKGGGRPEKKKGTRDGMQQERTEQATPCAQVGRSGHEGPGWPRTPSRARARARRGKRKQRGCSFTRLRPSRDVASFFVALSDLRESRTHISLVLYPDRRWRARRLTRSRSSPCSPSSPACALARCSMRSLRRPSRVRFYVVLGARVGASRPPWRLRNPRARPCPRSPPSPPRPRAASIHAVLVAGSNGWGNYRHQADVAHVRCPQALAERRTRGARGAGGRGLYRGRVVGRPDGEFGREGAASAPADLNLETIGLGWQSGVVLTIRVGATAACAPWGERSRSATTRARSSYDWVGRLFRRKGAQLPGSKAQGAGGGRGTGVQGCLSVSPRDRRDRLLPARRSAGPPPFSSRSARLTLLLTPSPLPSLPLPCRLTKS